MLKFRHTLKANRMYAAYKFGHYALKERSRSEFLDLSHEDRLNVVAFVHNQLIRTGLAEGAVLLMRDYKPELIKPEYDIHRGGSYEELIGKGE